MNKRILVIIAILLSIGFMPFLKCGPAAAELTLDERMTRAMEKEVSLTGQIYNPHDVGMLLYARPSLSGGVLRSVLNGTTVTVISDQISEQGYRWILVQTEDGSKGWVFATGVIDSQGDLVVPAEGLPEGRTVDYNAYLFPWESADIGAEVREAGELRFYFMSSAGFRVEHAPNEPEKWGDSCLVVFPTGEVMLIDTGRSEYAPILIRNLEKLGVKKIDYLLISHPHYDHAGGVYATDGIPDHFQIGVMLYGGTYNEGFDDPYILEKIMDDHGFPRQVISEGWTMDIGGVHLQVISPPSDEVGTVYKGKQTEQINNSSVLLRMDYRRFSALFTGDIYKSKEEILVRDKAKLLDVDLLKIPHHGQSTSSTKAFAEAVTPRLAVATGGVVMKDAQYEAYTQTGSKVLYDLRDGYIYVWTTGEAMGWGQG